MSEIFCTLALPPAKEVDARLLEGAVKAAAEPTIMAVATVASFIFDSLTS